MNSNKVVNLIEEFIDAKISLGQTFNVETLKMISDNINRIRKELVDTLSRKPIVKEKS